MIGSHNSYTHLDSTNSLYNNFTNIWKCQDTTVLQQYKDGCRFFDVRVKYEEKDGKTNWRACHGVVNLKKAWSSLEAICSYFTNGLPESKIRIVLETDDGKDKFIDEVIKLTGKYPVLIEVVIKSGWQMIYVCPNHPRFIDYNYEYWDGSKSVFENIANLAKDRCTLKEYAYKNNPIITPEMLSDENTVYFMDYVSYSLNKSKEQ